MSKSANLSIQYYSGQNEKALLHLWNEILARDPISPEAFYAKVLLDDNFQPENLYLAFFDGELQGFLLSVFRRVPLLWEGCDEHTGWITAFGVRQAARRQRIGTRLFEAAIERMQAHGRKRILISTYTPNYFTPGIDTLAYPEAIHFLNWHDWKVVESPVSMQIDLLDFRFDDRTRQIKKVLEEANIVFRPLSSEDLPQLMSMIGDQFGAEWLRHAREYLFDALVRGSPEVSFWIAEQGQNLVGYCQQKGERFGPFGVVHAMRRRGLGTVLLSLCLQSMKARGYRCAWFLWGEPDAARMYERSGFRTVRQFAVFEKELS